MNGHKDTEGKFHFSFSLREIFMIIGALATFIFFCASISWSSVQHGKDIKELKTTVQCVYAMDTRLSKIEGILQQAFGHKETFNVLH